MKKRILVLMCSALLVMCGALLAFNVAGVFAQNNLSSDVNLHLRDYCDPASFNAAVGPGTCARSTVPGAITFGGFIAELTADKSVGSNAPFTKFGRRNSHFYPGEGVRRRVYRASERAVGKSCSGAGMCPGGQRTTRPTTTRRGQYVHSCGHERPAPPGARSKRQVPMLYPPVDAPNHHPAPVASRRSALTAGLTEDC